MMSDEADRPRHLLVDDKHRKWLCIIPGFMKPKANIRNGMSIYGMHYAYSMPEIKALLNQTAMVNMLWQGY